MKITNKHGLPEALVRAAHRDAKPRNWYSPSMLTDSPRIVHLLRRHWEECTEDAVDSVWKLFGTAVHKVLEDNGEYSEIKLSGTFRGHELKGTTDLLTSGIIQDWKVTSAWTIVYGSRLEDWTLQLNAYKRMAEQMGYDIKGMQVIAILRDWSKTKAKDSADYPAAQVVTIDIPILYDADDIIADSLDAFEAASKLSDDDLPYCTNAQKWQDEDKYAVMMRGKKRAVKLHLSEEEAHRHAATIGGYVKERIGYPRRCMEYCPVKDFCNQYKEKQNG